MCVLCVDDLYVKKGVEWDSLLDILARCNSRKYFRDIFIRNYCMCRFFGGWGKNEKKKTHIHTHELKEREIRYYRSFAWNNFAMGDFLRLPLQFFFLSSCCCHWCCCCSHALLLLLLLPLLLLYYAMLMEKRSQPSLCAILYTQSVRADHEIVQIFAQLIL